MHGATIHVHYAFVDSLPMFNAWLTEYSDDENQASDVEA